MNVTCLVCTQRTSIGRKNRQYTNMTWSERNTSEVNKHIHALKYGATWVGDVTKPMWVEVGFMLDGLQNSKKVLLYICGPVYNDVLVVRGFDLQKTDRRAKTHVNK